MPATYQKLRVSEHFFQDDFLSILPIPFRNQGFPNIFHFFFFYNPNKASRKPSIKTKGFRRFSILARYWVLQSSRKPSTKIKGFRRFSMIVSNSVVREPIQNTGVSEVFASNFFRCRSQNWNHVCAQTCLPIWGPLVCCTWGWGGSGCKLQFFFPGGVPFFAVRWLGASAATCTILWWP